MNNFYTYMYSDPRDNIPFYVGKGQGERAYKWYEKNKQVVGKIKNLRKLGLQHIVEIAHTPSEEDAHWFEKDLIASLGRKDLGTGCLLNHTDGGEGIVGYRHTDQTKKLISELHRGGPGNTTPKTDEWKNRIRETNKKLGIAPPTRYQPLTEEVKQKISLYNKNTRWYNDGVVEIKVQTPPVGWLRGRLPGKCGGKNKGLKKVGNHYE